MECPKCGHEIFIKLALEELVFCPYCDQRMVPPALDEAAASGEPPSPPSLPVRDEVADVVADEPIVVETPETLSVREPERTEPPEVAQIPAEPQANEAVLEVTKEDTSTLQAVEQMPVAAPIEVFVVPAPEPVAEAPVLEEPVTIQPPVRTAPEAVESTPPVEKAEPPAPEMHPEALEESIQEIVPSWETLEASIPEAAVSQSPEPEQEVIESVAQPTQSIEASLPAEIAESAPVEKPAGMLEEPVQEIVAPPMVEEAAPPVAAQPQVEPVPVPEDIIHLAEIETPAIEPEAPKTREAPRAAETGPDAEFSFCYACGQKLPPGSSFCPRCGKNMQALRSSASPVEPRFPASRSYSAGPAKQEHQKPQATKKPAEVREVLAQDEQPSKQEPARTPMRNILPKFRTIAFREPMSEAMQDTAPAMSSYPKEKIRPDILKLVWLKVSGWATDIWVSVRGSSRKLWIQFKKFFARPDRDNARPLIDLSSAQALKTKRVTTPTRAADAEPKRLIYLILGALFFVAVFVFIGILLSR